MDRSDTRTVAIFVLIGFVIGATGIVIAASITGTVPVQNDIPLSSTDNTTVVLQGDTDALLEDFTILSGTVDLKTEAGNATVFSTGDTEVWIEQSNITGTWTNVTNISTGGTAIDIDPEDKQEVTVGKNIDHIAWRDNTNADDGTVDFSYGGTGGNSEVTLRNVTADAELEAVDANTNNILDKATADSNGAVTFDELTNSDHNVLLQTQDDNDAPVLSDPTPTGPQTSQPNTFEVDVNDSEFSQGDSVTAELFVEQVKKGQDTLTSNGTASVSHTPDLGKSIDYSWVATDSFGDTDTINATLTTPVNVTFREEHNASKVITGVNATITLFSKDATTIITRSDDNDDGNITLEGLPDKEFVVVAETDEHYTRRVYIESIFNQQNIFLLNKTEVPGDQAINTTFVYEDRSGQFPPDETTLRIQRGLDIDNDNESEWLTVAGDFWGAASEFPFTGEENARYRLIVENADGDRRVLGSHIPTVSGTKTVINGKLDFSFENATGRYFNAVLNRTNDEIQVAYNDPTNKSGDVRLRVWELGNRSNEIYDQNFTNSPYGELVTVISLTADQADKSWVVRYDTTHDDDGDIGGQQPLGGDDIILPVDPWLLAAFGVLVVTFAGTLYGPRTATMGAWIMVLTALGLTFFGLLDFPTYSIVAAVAIAAGGTFYGEAIP